MSDLQDKIRNAKFNLACARKEKQWRRDPSIVLVGAWFGDKFADNSRFLYQYLSDNKESLGLTHVVWVSRSAEVVEMIRALGYEAYVMDSEESVRFHRMAGYHLICNSFEDTARLKADILTRYSWGAVKVNLWHGAIGFKAVSMASHQYAENRRRHRALYFFKETLHKSALFRRYVEHPGGWGNCYFLSTSPLNTRLMTSFFQLPRDRYIETGFPRVCGTVRLLPNEEKVADFIRSFPKTILYLPTFRGQGSSFDFNEASRGMQAYLKKNNVLWIQKPHSAGGVKGTELRLEGNVLNLPHDFDINTIIPAVSLMVSDYSSAIGDAMYYNKPIAFYVPDFEEYRSKDRGFQRDPDEIMCGPKAGSTAELEQAIDGLLSGEFKPDEKYRSVRDSYFAHSTTLGGVWKDILAAVKK